MIISRRAAGFLAGAVLLLSACATPSGAPATDPTTDPSTAAGGATADATGSTDSADPASTSTDPSAQAPLTGDDAKLIVYSGRKESLIGPLIERFEAETGIQVDMRWGDTAPLAATLMEEGQASPADVFFAQDPGGLGAVEGLLAPLSPAILDRVPAAFRDPAGHWVGVSSRSRVVVYNTQTVKPQEIPADLDGFTDPVWKGRIGWAPTNASFQAMITAMRKLQGEEQTRAWLAGMMANEPVAYESNAPVVAAVGAGEVEVGLVNHYYLHRFLVEEGEGFSARNHFMTGGGPGAMVLVSGAGILQTAAHKAAAERFIAFLVSDEAQRFFVTESWEYPVATGVDGPADLPPLAALKSPALPLADLADLQGTIDLLRQTGVLP